MPDHPSAEQTSAEPRRALPSLDHRPASAPGPVASGASVAGPELATPTPASPSAPAPQDPGGVARPARWWQRTRLWLALAMILTVLCVGAAVLLWWDLRVVEMTPVPLP